MTPYVYTLIIYIQYFLSYMPVISDENRYKLLKLLGDNPDVSQRNVAQAMGISLGKANYCIKALISKGWIKAGNFTRSPNKKSYTYLLTLKGIEEKANVTLRFLERKQQEHKQLVIELEELRQEVARIKRSR